MSVAGCGRTVGRLGSEWVLGLRGASLGGVIIYMDLVVGSRELDAKGDHCGFEVPSGIKVTSGGGMPRGGRFCRPLHNVHGGNQHISFDSSTASCFHGS